MGFVPGTLVKAIPVPRGVEFTLHNEYILSYSELDVSTRKKGGKLIRVPYTNIPSLPAGGRYLYNAGLGIGDALIARYDYGLVRARKLPATAQTILRVRMKNRQTGKPSPKALLTGDWLPKFGFTPETSLTSISEPGRITFLALQNSKELQVRETLDNRNGKLYPYITVPGYCLKKAGFIFGDVLLVSCKPGHITLQKLDFEALELFSGQ